jgi:hypothetical protein
MSFAEKLEIILSGDAKGAVKAFAETAVAAQESAAKQKAAAGEASAANEAGAVKSAEAQKGASESGIASMGGMVTAVGAAGIAVFELSKKWDEAALSAGKLSEATGLTAEEASRWSVVAGNADVSTAALEKSIGFMNKTAGNSPKKFTELGIAIHDVNGQALSTSTVFLNVVDKLNSMEDPQKKASAGAHLLGKGWQSMAEIIGQGSAKLTESLKQVASTEVFSHNDVEKAKVFRDELKNVTNELKGIELQAGKAFVPIVENIVKALGPLATGIGKLVEFNAKLTDMSTTLGKFGSAAKALSNPIDAANTSLSFLNGTADGVVGSFGKLVDAHGNVLHAAKDDVKGQEEMAASLKATELAANTEAQALDVARMAKIDGKAVAKEAAFEQKAYTDELNATTKAIQDDLAEQKLLTDAYATAADKTYAVENAYGKLNETHDGLAKAVQGAHGDATKLALVYRQVALDAEALGQAQIALAEDQAAQAGTTVSATEKVDIMNAALLGQAATLNGPARQAVLYHIALINGLPPEVTTFIDAQINNGDLEGAAATIHDWSKANTVAVRVGLDQASLQDVINQLAKLGDRAAQYQLIPSPGGSGSGAFVGHNAGGTQNWQGGPTWVGELGPELLNLPSGSQITPADKSAKMMADSRASIVQNVTHTTINPATAAASSTAATSTPVDETAIARLKYERGVIDLAQFRAILVAKKAGLEQYSTAEDQVYKEIAQLDAKKAADETAAAAKKAADDKTAAAQSRVILDNQMKYEYDNGQISLLAYKQYLAGKLDNAVLFSNEWIALENQMESLQKAADASAAASAKKSAADASTRIADIVAKAKAAADLIAAIDAEAAAAHTELVEKNEATWINASTETDKQGNPVVSQTQKDTATAKAASSRAAHVLALIKGADARANAEGYKDDSPDWNASVRQSISDYEAGNSDYNSELDAYVATLPKFHRGGRVPGSPGQEVPIMAMAGETVLNSSNAGYTDNRTFHINLPVSLMYDRARARTELVTLLREHTRLNPGWQTPL